MRIFTIRNCRTAPTYQNQHLEYMKGDQESEKADKTITNQGYCNVSKNTMVILCTQ